MGRTLVICEKPSAAKRIAAALDDEGGPKDYRERGISYYVAHRGGEDLVVVSALGHLFTVTQEKGGWTYPVFDTTWAPIYEINKSASRSRGFINVIEEVSAGVNDYVSACDYDMEGSLIAYNILLHVCGVESLKKAKRMRYSTLTDRDIVDAWKSMSTSLDYTIIEAGRARHEVDWLFGINLSRALTLSVKKATGRFNTLSIGRVQGPTLDFVAERDVEIRTHAPVPFWVIDAETTIDGKRCTLEYERPRIETKLEALGVANACRGKEGVVNSVRSTMHNIPPPHPFSLGDLQGEAYHQFRYSPRTTLKAAERLYLAALISYPRTSSQRLPPSLDLVGILRGLGKQRKYGALANELLSKQDLKPRQGDRDDLAHPAIHPTGEVPGKLGSVEGRLYDLVCRRFMSTLGDPAVRLDTNAGIDVNSHRFHVRGSRILEQGWTLFYSPYFTKVEADLPNLKIRQSLTLTRLEAIRRFSKPAQRFNFSSLLKLMEEKGVGTKATRTEIIDTLFDRGYVEGSPIRVTDLGLAVIETLSMHCRGITSAKMTKELEDDLERIQTGDTTGLEVVQRSKETLGPILADFKRNEKLIGAEIGDVMMRKQTDANILGMCPICKSGEIKVLRNRQTGNRFAGCSNYLSGQCFASYPLPQTGRIQAEGKRCPQCGAPIIKLMNRGRRPWEICINSRCPSKKREIHERKM
jgi:DNA topoisomerase-1